MPDRRPAAAASRAAVALLLASVAAACGGGGGGGGGGGPSHAQDLASVSPSPQSAAQFSGAGDFAADYLRSTNFTSILVEIDYPADRPPSPGVTELLAERLAERCDKPDGITVLVDDPIPVDEFPDVLTTDDLDDFEDAYRDFYANQAAREVVLYVIYVHGSSDLGGGPTQVLGLTYHGSSVAIFVDFAEQGSDPFVTTAEVEGTGLVHEAGHCLGLTGSTVPMIVDHRDESHGYHDIDDTSVMYWLIQVPGVSPNLGDPDFAQFDQNSIDDLAAFGGLGPSPARIASPSVPDPVAAVVVAGCPHCRAAHRVAPGRR